MLFLLEKKRNSFSGDLGFNNAELVNAKTKFTEIDTQIRTLFTTCKADLDEAVSKGAFLGSEQVTALKTYLEQMTDAMADFLAKFGEFGEMLDTAAAKYASQVSSQASVFSSATTSIDGSGTN